MELLKLKPTFNQISFLHSYLLKDARIKSILDLSDPGWLWDCLKPITINQYKELNRLYSWNHLNKIIKILKTLGLKEIKK